MGVTGVQTCALPICELRQLRRLEDGRAELEPPRRAVDRRTDREHREEQPHADDEQRRRERPQRSVARASCKEEECDADEGIEALLAEVVRGVSVAERRLTRRRAEDHHQAERDECKRDQEKELRFELALLHGSSRTRRRNASPRSSKSRNWS